MVNSLLLELNCLFHDFSGDLSIFITFEHFSVYHSYGFKFFRAKSYWQKEALPYLGLPEKRLSYC